MEINSCRCFQSYASIKHCHYTCEIFSTKNLQGKKYQFFYGIGNNFSLNSANLSYIKWWQNIIFFYHDKAAFSEFYIHTPRKKKKFFLTEVKEDIAHNFIDAGKYAKKIPIFFVMYVKFVNVNGSVCCTGIRCKRSPKICVKIRLIFQLRNFNKCQAF